MVRIHEYEDATDHRLPMWKKTDSQGQVDERLHAGIILPDIQESSWTVISTLLHPLSFDRGSKAGSSPASSTGFWD